MVAAACGGSTKHILSPAWITFSGTTGIRNGQQKNFRSGAAAGRRNGRTGDGNLQQESGAKHRGMARF
ncbi:TPA_asm: hypothetical protein G0G78_25685 [Salmonella enterica]|nr:hypothetical protein [Salmonella enterica]EAU9426878.1 hypothetical protein [Salmonella enterica]HAC8239799.1 hypothetical protein [Salmonella enterica]HAC8273344.1 hypothetical protein [Salmonella enterica]